MIKPEVGDVISYQYQGVEYFADVIMAMRGISKEIGL